MIERVQWLINHPATLIGWAVPAVFLALMLLLGVRFWNAITGRGSAVDALRRAELKREIVFEMRRRMAPQSALEMAKHLTLDVFETARLLDTLVKEGLLESYTSTDRLTRWRLKGLPTRPTA